MIPTKLPIIEMKTISDRIEEQRISLQQNQIEFGMIHEILAMTAHEQQMEIFMQLRTLGVNQIIADHSINQELQHKQQFNFPEIKERNNGLFMKMEHVTELEKFEQINTNFIIEQTNSEKSLDLFENRENLKKLKEKGTIKDITDFLNRKDISQ